MNTFESIARQKLSLVVNNPHPRRREDALAYRMGTLAQIWGAVGFALGFWWSVGVIVRAMYGIW